MEALRFSKSLCNKLTVTMQPHILYLKIWCYFKAETCSYLLRESHEFRFKGCGMGPWLVLVSLRFRENVVATCKIGSFLCSLDNLPQENVIVLFFFEIKFQNGAHLKKGLFLTYFSHFLVTTEKLQKILHHIPQTHTYT